MHTLEFPSLRFEGALEKEVCAYVPLWSSPPRLILSPLLRKLPASLWPRLVSQGRQQPGTPTSDVGTQRAVLPQMTDGSPEGTGGRRWPCSPTVHIYQGLWVPEDGWWGDSSKAAEGLLELSGTP